MSDTYYTLCSSCKHTSTCTFPKDPQRPSFYCEEFEIEVAPQTYGRPPTQPYIEKVKESTGLVGLCSDCENQNKCSFPKPEGGIWHCEEYR